MGSAPSSTTSEAKKAGELSKILEAIKKLDLLICDEWGYVPLDREAAQLLFQIVSESYERRSVLVTTNLGFSRWTEVFQNVSLTAALLDRLTHHSHVFLFTRGSYRFSERAERG